MISSQPKLLRKDSPKVYSSQARLEGLPNLHKQLSSKKERVKNLTLELSLAHENEERQSVVVISTSEVVVKG